MKAFTYITQNKELIEYLVKIGFINCSMLRYCEIYSRYDQYLRQGYSSKDAIAYCCDDFCIERSWVYVIIKKMEVTV